LGFIVLTHEMQNAECKMQNYDSLPFLHGNEPGEPNGVEIFAGLKARGVSGDSPLNCNLNKSMKSPGAFAPGQVR
jgi:hypothetical protein